MVGHVLRALCSLMCTSHRDVSVLTQPFNESGDSNPYRLGLLSREKVEGEMVP